MEVTPLINQSSPQALFGAQQDAVLGKDDFLKILVTQLRNQDPINPVKGDEFAVQLAQFSSVEQLQNINLNLENNLEMNLLLNQALNNTLATTLIGNNVKALGNLVNRIEGQDSALNYRLASSAQDVTIEISDASGAVVRTVQLEGQLSGDHSYTWDGKDDSGNPVSEGVYNFSVTAADAEGNSVGALTFIAGIINSIRYNNGAAMLLLGDIEVSLSDVFEIGLTPDDAGPVKRISVRDN